MVYLLTILFYLVVLFAIGLHLTKRLKRKEDFLVAGRSLTAPVLVGTLLASWIGSGDIFSVSDLSYNHGFSSLIGSSGGWLGIIIVFFIAGRVRTFGQFTVPDILEARYNKWARILATVVTIIAYVTIVSYQFRGGGWVLDIITGGKISAGTGIIIIAVFVITYTLLAGMISVAYLDIFNGIVMITGILLALPFLIQHVGGMDYIVANVTERSHSFLGNMTWVQAMGYFVPTLLLALGQGNMYQRFFSAKNEKEAKKSVVGWVVGVILLGIALQSLAVVGSSYFKGLEAKEAGKIIILVAHKGVPVAVGCLLAYSLISFFPRILDAAYAAYTVYGAGITPALVAVFFWKRATASGGVLSMLGGTTVTIVWEIVNKIQGHLPFGIPAIYPALVVSLVLLFGVSLLTPKPPPEKWRAFFKNKDLTR